MTGQRVVKFVTTHNPWPWARQTPDGNGVVGSTRFVFDADSREYDFLVVYDEVPADFGDRVHPARTLFVASEPAQVKRYHPGFLAQFGTIITTDRETPHPNRIFTHPGLPWHLGVPTRQTARYGGSLDYRALTRLPGEKTKLISVICSNKTMTPAQRQRIPFAHALKRHFGDRLDFFGRGFNPVEDKAQALVPYRYHIALENSDDADYWSEKIADPFLAGAFPLYWGCRNLEQYFPPDSFVRLDISDPRTAIDRIEAVIAGGIDRERQNVLAEAKRRVLTEHNLFALLDRSLTIVEAGASGGATGTATPIAAEATFSSGQRLLTTIRRKVVRGLKRGLRMTHLLARRYPFVWKEWRVKAELIGRIHATNVTRF